MANVAIRDELNKAIKSPSKQDRHKINRLLLDIQDDCLTNGGHSERLNTSADSFGGGRLLQGCDLAADQGR